MRETSLQMSKLVFVALTIVIGFSVSQAKEPSFATNQGAAPIEPITAETLASDWEHAPIRSYADLHEHIKGMPDNNSPLNRLSEAALTAFVDSLVITKNGLGSLNSSPLKSELTPSEVTEVLSLFGAQRLTPALYDAELEGIFGSRWTELKSDIGAESECIIHNKKCEAPATCKPFWGVDCIWCNCNTP